MLLLISKIVSFSWGLGTAVVDLGENTVKCKCTVAMATPDGGGGAVFVPYSEEEEC